MYSEDYLKFVFNFYGDDCYHLVLLNSFATPNDDLVFLSGLDPIMFSWNILDSIVFDCYERACDVYDDLSKFGIHCFIKHIS